MFLEWRENTFVKLRAKDFVAVEAALRHELRRSGAGTLPVGSALRRCRREIKLDWFIQKFGMKRVLRIWSSRRGYQSH